jgi:hypothetical protein
LAGGAESFGQMTGVLNPKKNAAAEDAEDRRGHN